MTEDKTTITDYKLLHEQNAIIHAFMGESPTEEYVVSTLDESASCLNPKNVGYDWPLEQKKVCDDWVAKHGHGQYKTRKVLNYPYYNQNWNKLMPVVEKINNTIHPELGERIDVIIYRRTCHINDMQQIIIETTGKDMLECTYKAVLEFIRWYNSIQNKEQS